MRRRGVREGLIRRCEEVMRETISRVEGRGRRKQRVLDGEGSEAGVPVEPMPIYAFAGGHG